MPPPIAEPPVSAAPAAGAPSAAPASPGVINVEPPKASTEAPPKPGSAKEGLFKELGKKAKGAAQPAQQPTQTEPGKAAPSNPQDKKTPESGPSKPGEEPAAAVTDPAAAGKPQDKKINPWKLVDEYKAKAAKLEQELASKGQLLPENDRKAFEERVTKAEARAKEMEDHMRYVDYSKTEDFKTKYVKPYENAWGKAMAELREIKVTDPQTQAQRDVTAQDMLTLVNLPLGEAREIADNAFGKFADDVMAHRKEIRGLYDAQAAALEEAKKTGAEREQQAREQAERTSREMNDSISKIWTAENEAAAKDEKYGIFFTPKEGDEQWNQRLTKGYELVDRGFKENPNDPKLTAEQRQGIIRRHAAIRNRAASWGAIRGELEKSLARVAELEKELGQYKSSEPGTAGGKPGTSGAPGPTGNAKQQMFGDLKKLAKVA